MLSNIKVDINMKVTIHQPEHFPYEGFFQKMNQADIFVVLDNVNFRKNYYQNRNKFINVQGKDEWFGVSIPKKSTSLKINEVIVQNERLNNWRNKVIKKIKHNFKLDMSEVYKYNKLIDINMASIEWCRQKLDIKTPMIFASSLNVEGAKSDLLASICKNLKASNETINFYTKNNIAKNSFFFKEKNTFFLNKNFFKQPSEVAFRSFGEILNKISKKYYLPRGKSISAILSDIQSADFKKTTLGGCIIQKISETIVVFPERS